MLGKRVVLDALYPRPMLPCRSWAILPIHRWMPSVTPGAYVPSWKTEGLLFGLRSSHHRMPDMVEVASTD